jgi:hypothetical protein
MLYSGCKTSELVETALLAPLEPKDFLQPPKILDSTQEFGFLHTTVVTVPADRNIYLAKAEPGTEIVHPSGSRKDTVDTNAPVKILEGVLEGGEVLDIFATGTARNVPVSSIQFGPNGGTSQIEIERVMGYNGMTGAIGSLVGMFDNEKQPFMIGQRKQIYVPNKAKVLYLAVLDYPGYSSDNQGEYIVSIDVIRR